MLSPEQMFQRVWDHFVDGDGKPSMSRPEPWRYRFLYRDGFGNKCAIGLFIPDEMYQSDLENADIFAVLNYCGLIPPRINQHHATFIAALQQAHDNSALFYEEGNPAEFREKMRGYLEKVASGFGIKFTSKARPQT